MMRLRDLGTLVVEVEGVEQPVAGAKGAAILALLAMSSVLDM
jgi:hypothetical protein